MLFVAVQQIIYKTQSRKATTIIVASDAYVRHDSFICVTRLIYMCDMTLWYVWHDSWRTGGDSSHVWMSHATQMNEPCHTYEWVMSHKWMSHVTHMNESCHTYEWVMSHDSWHTRGDTSHIWRLFDTSPKSGVSYSWPHSSPTHTIRTMGWLRLVGSLKV